MIRTQTRLSVTMETSGAPPRNLQVCLNAPQAKIPKGSDLNDLGPGNNMAATIQVTGAGLIHSYRTPLPPALIKAPPPQLWTIPDPHPHSSGPSLIPTPHRADPPLQDPPALIKAPPPVQAAPHPLCTRPPQP
ncbi:Hypp7854 [Branchiostoma lanceolatum]|uniref:Hypp7854 protein n=1 Tax=Branchiostoma lanceolatum TaxID=7740 RepID=A0A8J9Z435_BRALA|nr:Hypp7854 [Branchiostoma lanceolatum]